MKNRMINDIHVEGYLYEHNLEKRETGPNSKNPGTEYISGTIGIATDEAMNNVVQIHYSYQTAVTSKGKPNNTYNVLQAIIDEKMPTVMGAGKENAARVRVDSSIALNEWYDSRTDGNPLISMKRNEGGFIHQMTIAEPLDANENNRARFDCDILLTKATRVEPNEERNTPEKVVLKGYIFDFRKAIMPVEFSVLSPAAMNYFESLEVSGKNPVFTRIKGVEVSQTIEREIREESAFGDDSVRTVRSSQRDFVVNWAARETYLFDDESTLLASEVQKALAEREVYLADMKKRNEEYLASKGNAIPGEATPVKKDDYDF